MADAAKNGVERWWLIATDLETGEVGRRIKVYGTRDSCDLLAWEVERTSPSNLYEFGFCLLKTKRVATNVLRWVVGTLVYAVLVIVVAAVLTEVGTMIAEMHK